MVTYFFPDPQQVWKYPIEKAAYDKPFDDNCCHNHKKPRQQFSPIFVITVNVSELIKRLNSDCYILYIHLTQEEDLNYTPQVLDGLKHSTNFYQR